MPTGADEGDTTVIDVRSGLRGSLRAIILGRRRARALPAHGELVSCSPPAAAHLVARFVRPRGVRWTAHVDAPLRAFRDDRWGRVLDPRLRALRRADAVVAAPKVARELHASAGVAVAPEPGPRPSPRAADGLTILMLGTLNTPHVEHLALAMRDRGHRVVVGGDVVAGYPPSVLPAAGVEVRPLELPAMPWVRRLVRDVRPDVVHAHWLTAYGVLAAAMRLRPLIAMAWGSDVYRATPFQLLQIRFVLRRADFAMTDSSDLLSRLVELGADPGRAHLLNWGVDLDRFAPAPDRRAVRSALGLGDGPMVLSPRAVAPLYNVGVIAEAFERAGVAGSQLVVKHIATGEPDIGRPLPAGARIVGHVPYAELAEYYRAANVCVSIPDSDSSPRSVWEAMACGCSCVLSDLPWVDELIEDGRHALVVAPTPEAVAAAVRRLLTDPQLAARIGSEGRALVEAHRSQGTEMDRLSALYRAIASHRA